MAIKCYILIDSDGVKKKAELEKNHFQEYQCLGVHVAQAVTALSLTLSMKMQVHFLVIQAAPFQHFWRCTYIQLCEINFSRNFFIIFCMKLTICMYIKYIKNNSYKNLFLIFLLYNCHSRETRWKRVSLKNLIFFQLEIFVDKITFNFQSCNKVNDFLTNQSATAIFFPFYMNPQSWQNENGMGKAQFS